MAKDGSKKRKRQQADPNGSAAAAVDTSKPTAVFEPTQGRQHTVSLAVPGSIIANAQTHDQKTALAGTIARALAVFSIDEVVIFDDGHNTHSASSSSSEHAASDAASGYSAFADPPHFLQHLLAYLETPPHLRRALFGMHPNLRTAGALPSLDMPHHLRADEWCRWREGVTLRPRGTPDPSSSLVNAGLTAPVSVPVAIPPDTRVTLDFGTRDPPWLHTSAAQDSPLAADAVHPAAPRESDGYYWGYSVRRAESISTVFTEAPYDGGYDFCVGTSERGEALGEFLARQSEPAKDGLANSQTGPRRWQHLLVTFGGVAGLEVAVRNDAELRAKGVVNPAELFDAWVNLVPGQGSRTIRTEEAVWIGLMGLQDLLTRR